MRATAPPAQPARPQHMLLCLATAILLQKLAAKMPRYLNIYMEEQQQQQQQQENQHHQQQQQQNFVINNLHICFGNGKNSASFTLRVCNALGLFALYFCFPLAIVVRVESAPRQHTLYSLARQTDANYLLSLRIDYYRVADSAFNPLKTVTASMKFTSFTFI